MKQETTKKETLLNEIEDVTEPLIDEVIDFLHFLKLKALQEKNQTAFASESSLRKDWIKPEEDEAWRNL